MTFVSDEVLASGRLPWCFWAVARPVQVVHPGVGVLVLSTTALLFTDRHGSAMVRSKVNFLSLSSLSILESLSDTLSLSHDLEMESKFPIPHFLGFIPCS